MKRRHDPRHANAALSNIVLHQRLPQETLDRIALTLLVHFDACKRNRGDNFSANIVAMHINMAACFGSMKANRAFYNLALEAFVAFNKTCSRPDPVALTTTEYWAIRSCLGRYLKDVLPIVIWKEYIHAEVASFNRFDIPAALRVEFIKYTRAPSEAPILSVVR